MIESLVKVLKIHFAIVTPSKKIFQNFTPSFIL